jgi:hypothetical protein
MPKAPLKAPRFVVYHALSRMVDKVFYFEHQAQARVFKLINTRSDGDRYTYGTIEHFNHYRSEK